MSQDTEMVQGTPSVKAISLCPLGSLNCVPYVGGAILEMALQTRQRKAVSVTPEDALITVLSYFFKKTSV